MELNKKKIKQISFRIGLCLLGSFILAFATAVFLTPANIVAGGVSGIGIILNYFLEPIIGFSIVDIVAWTIYVILFVVSYFFLGRQFTIHTLIASFAYPAFLTLIIRTNMFEGFSKYFLVGTPEFGDFRLLLAGVLGGLVVGVGVAITFIGDGSTGGFDILCFVIYKYLHIKQSISSFVFDAVIILASLSMPNNVVPMLIGILSALISAIAIDVIYVRGNTTYIVDITTTKYEEINDYIINVAGRTTTIFDVTGAYSKKNFKLLRFVVDRRNFQDLEDHIAEVDPKAFITVCNSKQVLGEGFSPVKSKKKKRKNNGTKI